MQADVCPLFPFLPGLPSMYALHMGKTVHLKVSSSVSEADSFDRQWSGIHPLLGKVTHEE